MKTIIKLLTCLFMGFAIIACSNELAKENSEYITMWVSAETTTVYDEWLDADMECMLVRFSPDSEWEPMPLGKIQGFSYKKGMEYELIVYRSTPLNGPSAGENFAYRLYKIIRKTDKRVVVEGLEQYYTIPYEGGEIEAHFTSNMPWRTMTMDGSVDYGSEVTIDKEAEDKYVIRFSPVFVMRYPNRDLPIH